MAEITREHILDFRNCEAETFAPKTVNHDLKAVKMLFLSARRDGLITENPAEDVKTVAQRGEKRSRRPFSVDELRSALSVADDEWRSMILFGLYTGARLSDVASLTWENIDLPARELRFTAKKTGKTIVVETTGRGGHLWDIVKTALETPEEQKQSDDWRVIFFPWQDDPAYCRVHRRRLAATTDSQSARERCNFLRNRCNPA